MSNLVHNGDHYCSGDPECPMCDLRDSRVENTRLRKLLIERDGGTHDTDCKIHNPSIKRCTCGHDEVAALIGSE